MESYSIEALQITDKHREILRHTLGVGRGGNRNYYCVGVGTPDESIMNTMSEWGLMKRGRTINEGKDRYFYATESGAFTVGVKLK
mgnify:CR=1 FL=1